MYYFMKKGIIFSKNVLILENQYLLALNHNTWSTLNERYSFESSKHLKPIAEEINYESNISNNESDLNTIKSRKVIEYKSNLSKEN